MPVSTGLDGAGARLEGIEPPTTGLEGRCSIQLSYRRGRAKQEGRSAGVQRLERAASDAEHSRHQDPDENRNQQRDADAPDRQVVDAPQNRKPMAAELAGEAAFALETAVRTLTHKTNLEPTGGGPCPGPAAETSLGPPGAGPHAGLNLSSGHPGRYMLERTQGIGAPGFEPGTSCSQSRRATGLRHAPSIARVKIP
jgi:hypothetical protein